MREFEEPPVEESAGWHPPVPCPRCKLTDTRFVTYRDVIGVYVCEVCDIEFEVEE